MPPKPTSTLPDTFADLALGKSAKYLKTLQQTVSVSLLSK